MKSVFNGYRRENGTVGVRNHVAIIGVDGLSTTSINGICNLIKGTTSVTQPYGRLQFGEDLDILFKTLIGIGSNPNVSSALVVGLEPSWAGVVLDGILKTGKRAELVAITGNGTLKTIERGARIAKEMVSDGSEVMKEPFDLSEMTVSMKCGASDTTSGMAANPAVGICVDTLIESGANVIFGESSEITGAEHILAKRAINNKVRGELVKTIDDYVQFALNKGVSIHGSQPSQENIAGGLSTIEEKALGNILKTGTKTIQGVLKPAESPKKNSGLYFMDTSSSAQEAVTLFAAAGAQVHLFPTGQGNVVGNPIEPVIKITANPKTAKAMSENMDIDVSNILKKTLSIAKAGDSIFNEVIKVASGKLTSAEILGQDEFAITRLYKSM